MIEGIDVVFLHVKDQKMMVKWYSEKLGLKIKFQVLDNSWQEFSMENNSSTRFALDHVRSKPSNVERQSIIISFKVKNIFEVVAKLEELNVNFIGKEKIIDVGTSLVATFQDPEGNYLQLSQTK
ncbi:MAG: VOC family protein [Candidatus Thorarchaeota archaeon]